MSNNIVFTKGKKKRNELRLPTLHFVVADNWIDTLGVDAFRAWLKFHTYVDRTNGDRDFDRLPMSLQATWEKLGMGKKKFYEKIICPLWEYGLIELIEYENSTRKTQKPVNIVVYDYPFNDKSKETIELEKLRDWKNDYKSSSQLHGLKGGRPIDKGEDNQNNSHRFQTETVHGFQTETVTVSKQKPNNVLNNSSNVSNNSINHVPNNSFDDDEKETRAGARENLTQLTENHPHLKPLFDHLKSKMLDPYIVQDIMTEMLDQHMLDYRLIDARNQLDYMKNQIGKGESYTYFGRFFVNGLKKRSQTALDVEYENEVAQQQQAQRDTSIYYDWLHDDSN